MATDNVRQYQIVNPRYIVPEGAVAAKNPDRKLTLKGDFFPLVDGKAGDVLTSHSMNIDTETWDDPAFDFDLATGILTLPAGERGRKVSAGVSADVVAEMLATRKAEAQA